MRTTAYCLILAIFAVSAFVRLMDFNMRRDEQLYVPPATLLSNHDLYSEFFYNHVPLSAWLFHGFHSLLPSVGLLLSARILVFGFFVLFAGIILWTVWNRSRSFTLGLVALFAICGSELFLGVVGMIGTNNLLPLPLVLLGTVAFIKGLYDNDTINPLLTGIAGVLLGLAISIKASSVCFVPVPVIAAFLLPREFPFVYRFYRSVVPLAAGGVVGTLSVVYYLVRDPSGFLAHVVGFHTGPHLAFWRAASDSAVAMSFTDKIQLATSIWFGGGSVLLIVLSIGFLILAGSLSIGSRTRFRDSEILLIAGCQLIAAALFCFLPTPSFPQYFVLPYAVVPLVLALCYGGVPDQLKRPAEAFILAALVVAVVISAPRMLQALPRIASWKNLETVRVHRTGLDIARTIHSAGIEGKVATFLPIYPLEGGLDVYPELATGQFIYRSADMTREELLRHYVTTSPSRIEDLLVSDPPAAILVGFEPELEAPILSFAETNNYRKVDNLTIKDRYGTGELYLRVPSGQIDTDRQP